MPDISMCTGDGCTLKENCYRFKAKASHYQSYILEPPHKGVDEDGNSKCEYYWTINKTKQKT
tara:strand:- start:1443 stop:1628 length:186 start_codon:yes stop_codon:yes gene_type:complete